MKHAIQPLQQRCGNSKIKAGNTTTFPFANLVGYRVWHTALQHPLFLSCATLDGVSIVVWPKSWGKNTSMTLWLLLGPACGSCAGPIAMYSWAILAKRTGPAWCCICFAGRRTIRFTWNCSRPKYWVFRSHYSAGYLNTFQSIAHSCDF